MTREAHRLVVAGGGVAALEAVLAVRACAGAQVRSTILAPDPVFRHRPLSVTEPFSLAAPRGLSLESFAAEQDGQFVRGAMAEVDSDRKVVRTREGLELPYDFLLIAVGARAGVTIPGAVAFWDVADRGAFKEILGRLDRGEIEKIAFAVPAGLGWPLALYELALLTSAHARRAGVKVEILIATPEARPMALFGQEASSAVEELLRDAAVRLRLGHAPVAFRGGRLELADGDAVTCDTVVSLPHPRVEAIPGITQDARGFISTDRFGEVLGMDDVFAAGDVTTFPVKQGGIAAQAADGVASVIASRSGCDVSPEPFRPILRGAILTRTGPRYMRASFPKPRGAATHSVLWWPPAKIAGRHLAPYLAKRAGYAGQGVELTDLDPPPGEHAGAPAEDHRDLVASALRSAHLSADGGRYDRALHWLEVAEDLAMYLPPEFETRRGEWQRKATGLSSRH